MTHKCRFQSPDARIAARRLIDKAKASGLAPRATRSAVTAFELFDATGKAPFSIIANQNHALVYLRQPALKQNPGRFDRATAAFGEVTPNRKGEYRWRVTHPDELDRILEWLEGEQAWPRERHCGERKADDWDELKGLEDAMTTPLDDPEWRDDDLIAAFKGSVLDVLARAASVF